jgi:sterol desaturase/sphingolipid hydroxylase (fatty acid hydroxylase superfamily)
MEKLKSLGWLLSLLFACGLVLLVRWHGELQDFAGAHHDLAYYFALAFLLAIPARIIALAAAYLLELLFVGWSRSSLKMLWEPRTSVRLDVLSILVMLLLPQKHLRYLLSFGLLYLLDVYAAQRFDLSLTRFLALWELQVVGFVLLQSFVQYWLHRLEHTIPALWALHKFHHSADRMTILTSARQTQFTRGVEAGLVFLPMALLTSPAERWPATNSPLFVLALLILAYQTFILINGYLCHSNLRTGYGWLGRWLIVSPRMHRLHHATTPAYHNKNFSNDLVIWDRLFGTYATCDAATDIATVPIGLDDNPFNEPTTMGGALRVYFLTTYVVFWQELKKGFVAYLPVRFGIEQRTSDRQV